MKRGRAAAVRARRRQARTGDAIYQPYTQVVDGEERAGVRQVEAPSAPPAATVAALQAAIANPKPQPGVVATTLRAVFQRLHAGATPPAPEPPPPLDWRIAYLANLIVFARQDGSICRRETLLIDRVAQRIQAEDRHVGEAFLLAEGAHDQVFPFVGLINPAACYRDLLRLAAIDATVTDLELAYLDKYRQHFGWTDDECRRLINRHAIEG